MKRIIIIFLFMAGIASLLSAQNENSATNVPFDLGEKWFARKEYRNAVLFYSKAVERNYIPAYYKRGLSFFELGRFDQAIKDFDKCVKNNYMVNEAKSKKELALTEQKKTVKTETQTDFGSGVNSKGMAKQFYDQGMKEYIAGDYKKALSFYKSAVGMDPLSADAYAFIALINSHLESYEEVVNACNSAIEKKDYL